MFPIISLKILIIRDFCYLKRYSFTVYFLYLHTDINTWETMGRKRKSPIGKSPFKLRHRKLADGRISLFLDRSVDGKHEYEFLQLYLLPEDTAKAKRQNARTMREAESILQERTEALLTSKAATVEHNSSGMLLSEWMEIVRKWKSYATLTLLAKQDCPLWLQYD